jgi:hypothetical protein
MTTLHHTGSRARWSLGLTTFVIAMGGWSEAHAQSREWIDVSLGARAATSPYLTDTDNSAAVAVSLSVDGAIVLEGEVTRLALVGNFRLDQYIGRYGTDKSGGAGANLSTRLSERTSVGGSIGARTSESAAQEFIRIAPIPPTEAGENPVGPVLPELPEPPLPDITTAGQGARVNYYSASIFLNHVLSSTQSLGLGANASHTDTESPGGRDHWQYGANVSYSQRLSERLALSANVQANKADYPSVDGDDATTVSPLVGIDYRLGPSTTLQAQVGASWTTLSGGDQYVNVAANASLCHRRQLSSICASASRSSQPTTFGGVATVTSAALSYSLKTGLRDNLSIGARYGRTSQIGANRPDVATEVYGATATYSRAVGQRLFLFVTPSATKYSTSFGGRSDFNAQVEAGIRYRLGYVQ